MFATQKFSLILSLLSVSHQTAGWWTSIWYLFTTPEMNELSIEELHLKLLKSLTILRKFDWLLDAYVLDFYVDDHWSKVPSSWRETLEALPPALLSILLSDDDMRGDSRKAVWPLTLLALKQALRDLCISRRQLRDNKTPVPCQTLVSHPKLKPLFTKCVKPKKRHEIERMAEICWRSCSQTPVDFVVDFGAGLGHLARVLGYGYGIRVCCLEMQPELNAQAIQIDARLETIALKNLSPFETATFQTPTHVTLRLTANMRLHEFLNTITAALGLAPDKSYRFGIVGLHPCGDLATILMRMFLNCTQAKFLNLVGCCYMKLSTSSAKANDTKIGYPLSDYLKQFSTEAEAKAHLSYEAREISCHASEVYCDRLNKGCYEHLKVHSFRAATERILIKHWPELRHCGLRSVKHVPGMQFEDYFYKAVQGLPAASLHPMELTTDATLSDLQHWQRIVVFYTLRLMLAPLVESIILSDRILYLRENGCQVEINAIFDPLVSPRNHITCAFKHS